VLQVLHAGWDFVSFTSATRYDDACQAKEDRDAFKARQQTSKMSASGNDVMSASQLDMDRSMTITYETQHAYISQLTKCNSDVVLTCLRVFCAASTIL
jgi:hypothetical protein